MEVVFFVRVTDGFNHAVHLAAGVLVNSGEMDCILIPTIKTGALWAPLSVK